MNSQIHYLSRDYLYYEFTVYTANFVRIYVVFRGFTINSLGVTRINFEFTIHFENSLWIKYLFGEFTIYSLSLSWIHPELTWYFANSLWIHYPFHDLTVNSLDVLRMYYRFCIESLIYYELPNNFANILIIHYNLFREFTNYFAYSLYGTEFNAMRKKLKLSAFDSEYCFLTRVSYVSIFNSHHTRLPYPHHTSWQKIAKDTEIMHIRHAMLNPVF